MTLYEQMTGQPKQQPQQQQPQINQEMVESAKRMMGMLEWVSNPQKAIEMLASKNPQINAIMNMARGQGGLKSLFYSQAKQMGIDPNSILSQLK